MPAITCWIADQLSTDLFIAAFTVAELWRGIPQRAPGRGQHQLFSWFIGPNGPQNLFRNRILAFDLAAGMEWARIMAEGSLAGHPRSGIDMIIAATAVAHDCVV